MQEAAHEADTSVIFVVVFSRHPRLAASERFDATA